MTMQIEMNGESYSIKDLVERALTSYVDYLDSRLSLITSDTLSMEKWLCKICGPIVYALHRLYQRH